MTADPISRTAPAGQGVDQRPHQVVHLLLDEITEDLDLGVITDDRRLGDLGMESIGLVYLIAEVQQEFGLGDSLLQALRSGPRADVRAMTVGAFTTLVADLIEQRRVDGPSGSGIRS
jgi:hypothetical protein